MARLMRDLRHTPSSTLAVETRNGLVYLIPDEHMLRDPRPCGDYVRAYCHLHGSDHQRSLSIHRASGWGRCFNAACGVRVLMESWNPEVAARLRARAGVLSARPSLHVVPARSKIAPAPIISAPTWQRQEVALLHICHPHLRRVLPVGASPALRKARAYLASRQISSDLATMMGVSYLPTRAHLHLGTVLPSLHRSLLRWQDRLLFPLTLPTGPGGYIGRSLWGWQPGLSEEAHHALLARPGHPRRWLKTNPAGWFGPPPEALGTRVALVEGAFDRLALLAAGLAPHTVVALCGTALDVAWLPDWVEQVVLALDGDRSGMVAMITLAQQLRRSGKTGLLCPPPADELGKDWSERWRRAGRRGVEPVLALMLPSRPLSLCSVPRAFVPLLMDTSFSAQKKADHRKLASKVIGPSPFSYERRQKP